MIGYWLDARPIVNKITIMIKCKHVEWDVEEMCAWLFNNEKNHQWCDKISSWNSRWKSKEKTQCTLYLSISL